MPRNYPATAPIVWDWAPQPVRDAHRMAQDQGLSLGRYRFTPHDAPKAEWGYCLQRPLQTGFNMVGGPWRSIESALEWLAGRRVDPDDEDTEPI